MGVISYDTEVTTSIPPAKFFKSFILDGDKILPKVLPQAIKSIEILEGDGGPGTIKLTTFGEASQFKCAKNRIDVIDKENFTYCYTIIEGDALMGLESIASEIKVLPSPDGGSICKSTTKYHTKSDGQITQEQIKAGKEKAAGMFKAVEAYVLANPDAC